MLRNIETFSLQAFLNSGAIFINGDRVWLFWGEAKFQNFRPSGPAICAPPFSLPEKLPWVEFEHCLETQVEGAKTLFQENSEKFTEVSWQEPDVENFQTQFQWIRDWEKQGVATKVVPYVFEKGELEIEHISLVLENWIANALLWNQGFTYGFWNGEQGILGCTPETLIEQRASTVFQTMALAGTTTREAFQADKNSFLENKKEIKEHELVVEDICSQLSPWGEVTVGQREICLTPSLVHFKTSICLRCDRSLEDVLRALHPTPALGVYPRTHKDMILEKLDSINPRERFGAPFGISLDSERGHFVVAIRNVEWNKKNLRLGSGCGVIGESVMDREWSELRHKRDSVKKIFGML